MIGGDSLASLWDGEQHWLELGEFFPETGARMVIDRWEEDEEYDVLSPFESPTLIPILRETGDKRSDEYWAKFPMQRTEQAWGSLSITLTALSMILGVSKKQYQHHNYKAQTNHWSFISEPLTERL